MLPAGDQDEVEMEVELIEIVNKVIIVAFIWLFPNSIFFLSHR